MTYQQDAPTPYQEVRTAAYRAVTALNAALPDLPPGPVADAYRQIADETSAVLARTPAGPDTQPAPGITTTRINALGDGTTLHERQNATLLLDALLAAAATHGVTLDDLDAVTDLPRVCLDLVRTKTA
ncbi:hypothetical protein RND61_30750 [Streptomyces sp. TRM76323]|uniref:TetR family transcriptional regulator n=1 Tax=Streptomyces tamarix TaxID=3078565 RepID=A0ABU3QUH9_9ACTN|nr:hypothetical protein [Streptomyces tamarix]MDT9686418.1 hypothetical protein [Streptomyces tamarix]